MYRKKAANIITADGPDGSMYVFCVDEGAGFKVGDVVRLNANGLYTIAGLRTKEHFDSQVSGVKITEMLSDQHAVAGVFPVTLDGPLGEFLITTNDIEKV